MKQWKIWMLPALLLIASASFIGCSSSGGKSEGTTTGQASTIQTGDSSPVKIGTAVGNTAPEFQLANTNGASVSLDSLRGQPAVLVFWTAWCPSCKEEAPHINELAAKYEAQGVRVLGINIQDSPVRLAGGVKEINSNFTEQNQLDECHAERRADGRSNERGRFSIATATNQLSNAGWSRDRRDVLPGIEATRARRLAASPMGQQSRFLRRVCQAASIARLQCVGD